MKTRAPAFASGSKARSAHTMAEVAVAVGVLGIMVLSLYAGFINGFGILRLTREDLRATQVLTEKTEMLRLYNWDQLNTAGYVPSSFTAAFYTTNLYSTNLAGASLVYTGLVSGLYTNAPVPEGYASNMRLITIQLNWSSDGQLHTCQTTTLVSKYGLQNYVY